MRLITIAGIELMHRIRKGQFKLEKLRINCKTAPEIWNEFSPHEPCNVPDRFAAPVVKVCTTAMMMPLPSPRSIAAILAALA